MGQKYTIMRKNRKKIYKLTKKKPFYIQKEMYQGLSYPSYISSVFLEINLYLIPNKI